MHVATFYSDKELSKTLPREAFARVLISKFLRPELSFGMKINAKAT